MPTSREADVAALRVQEFRSPQEEIVLAATAGHHVFVRMPTSGGKSLCFQVPALASSGTSIVISPLIGLMEDQVQNLRSLGVSCMLYSSDLDDEERDLAAPTLATCKLLYTTPEQLIHRTSRLVQSLLRMHGMRQVQRVVLDEAHCVLA